MSYDCAKRIMRMTFISKKHAYHLSKYAKLRKASLEEAVSKLAYVVKPSAEDWISSIDYNWGNFDGQVEIQSSFATEDLQALIQGLPRIIHPVAHGRYSEEVEIVKAPSGLSGVKFGELTIYDWIRTANHNRNSTLAQIYPLISDMFPADFSLDDYFAYFFFGSQYYDPITRPSMYALRLCSGICVDVGAYVGFKAFAMAKYNPGGTVYAYEMDSQNFELLSLNCSVNNQINIIPVLSGLSDSFNLKSFSHRRSPDMANSLVETISERGRNVDINHGRLDNIEHFVSITTLDLEMERILSSNEFIEVIHISVNGHEPEVLKGGINLLKRAKTIRIVAPYSRDKEQVYDICKRILTDKGFHIAGRNQSALLAGAAEISCFDRINYT